MIRAELLFATLIAAAVLTTSATARQNQETSQRITAQANACTVTGAHSAYGQAPCRNRADDLRGLAERDVWGHWGAYYGPMVH
jgi:hypothetical protein